MSPAHGVPRAGVTSGIPAVEHNHCRDKNGECRRWREDHESAVALRDREQQLLADKTARQQEWLPRIQTLRRWPKTCTSW